MSAADASESYLWAMISGSAGSPYSSSITSLKARMRSAVAKSHCSPPMKYGLPRSGLSVGGIDFRISRVSCRAPL